MLRNLCTNTEYVLEKYFETYEAYIQIYKTILDLHIFNQTQKCLNQAKALIVCKQRIYSYEGDVMRVLGELESD